MKLFGGKRSGAHSKETVMDAVTDEVLETAEAEQPAADESTTLAEQTEQVAFMEIPSMDAAEGEQVPDAAEEEGLMNSIAETLGLSQEEITHSQAFTAVEAEGKNMSRKEKKAAKKAEKKAAKAAKKAAKKWSGAKKALVAAVLVLSLAITGFAGYFVHEMWVTDEVLDIYQADFTGEIIYADDVEQVEIDQGQQVEEIPLDETRKKGCYTFLVAARDVASGCTDVIIVGRFDTENHTINMVSIPRDTMTNRADLKINTAYQGNLA
ncbi:MAG: LCP family protein, partial [Oscillospiraceae bacterium]|nr:LCP family protein [Oscillospiraceae bacterium]